MTPTPQEHAAPAQHDVVAPVSGNDRVVISGVSGLFANCHHITELHDILYNKKNPINSSDWKYHHPEISKYKGYVPDLDRFDAQFFKVHYRLGNCMDPMSRKVLEQAYSAIYDAGINPEQLSGKKIGVFIGACFSEAEKTCTYDANARTGLGITGCCKAMFANRISYWLNAKGPSMAIDVACCSSAAALEQAHLAMSRGDCEAAIVGGTYLCMHPESSIHYSRVTVPPKDGKTKSFDENADGNVHSEAISVMFLQKAKDALRIYAELMHAKTEYIGCLKGETGPKFGFYRNPNETAKFLSKFYEEAKIPPQAVEYVEACGSAVPDADKAELEAIDTVFCKEKEDTLLVGSVTSNLGYCEAASGVAGITKVLLGFHTGQLAANLNYENPRRDVEALRDGRIKILNEHHTFGRSYAAINGLSITGVNSHILLHGHYKPKNVLRYKSDIPHLVTLSARQDITINKVIDDLKSRPIDPEELALFNNIHQFNNAGHLGRGFAILATNEDQKTVSLVEKAEYFNDARRPLWFVYSGMGSQWAGMGTQLMRIPIFAAAIEKCRRVLEPKGIDIVHIITADDDKIFDNILHSFVGIAAVQIGLTDVLRELELVPDGIIGHSVGELGCAYADGCLTAEEMILSAYSRGLVSLQTPFIRGSMSAVGLGFEKISKIIPPEIEVACHNGPESSTISGPSDIIREFVAELTAKGIFAKEVPCSNIAYHSRYIADAGPGLLKYLKEVIKTPKQRSDRWVSTSVPKDRWNEELAQYSSAEYHTNNLLNPVLFEETLPLVPRNAVLVEVAPHGILQAILKRSLPDDCKNFGLTRRRHPDNTLLFLEAVGKLYMEGYNPKVQVLYPKVEMPVSTGTPFLSQHIEWAHGELWQLPSFKNSCKITEAACNFVISLHDQESQYLQGSVIKDQTVYPFSASLVAVWDTLAMSMNVPKKELSVEFEDVHFYVQPDLHEQRQLRFNVQIQKGTGKFEVLRDNILIASGNVAPSKTKDIEKITSEANNDDENMSLTEAEIYNLLEERDYSYSGDFRAIKRVNPSLSKADLVWQNNWVTLIEGMLQLNILRQAHDAVSQLKYIRSVCINVNKHTQTKAVSGDQTLLQAEVDTTLNFTRCGGIFIEDVRYHNLPHIAENEIELQTLQFIGNGQTNLDIATCLIIFLQIISENMNKNILKIVGITNYSSEGSVFDKLQSIGSNLFGIHVQYKQIDLQSSIKDRVLLNEADVVIVNNMSTNDNLCQQLHRLLRPDTYMITEEDPKLGNRTRPSALYKVLSTLSAECNTPSRLQLVLWRPTPSPPIATAVTIRTATDYPLLSSARANLPSNHRLLVFSCYPAPAGLKNLVQAWRKEADRNLIQLIMVNNEGSNLFVDELPEIDLAFSVVNQSKWGGEYYLPVQDKIMSDKVMLKLSQIGDYKSLYWTGCPEINKNEVIVNVHYAGISNVDVKKANGTIQFEKDADNCFGTDFSGTTPSGERVMGIVAGGAASTQVRAVPELLWPVPAHWSLEDAATVPLAYAHALYALSYSLGSERVIVPENSIFIFGGCGTVGQAAIALTLSIGCEVFTTVSDIRKKNLLLKMFPELKENHIGNSRDVSFADMILQATNGRGCDCVIITNIKQDLKDIVCRCAGYNLGRVIDLSQFTNQEPFSYGMSHLNGVRSFAALDFSSIFKYENKDELKRLQVWLSDGIARGYVRPLSRVTYEPAGTPRAFRLLAASRHRGRVLLHIKDNTPRVQLNRISCDPNQVQLLLFDEETYGIQLAARLVDRGAKKLHIHYKAQTTAKFLIKIRSWQRIGVEVQITSDILYTANEVSDIICNAQQLGSIQGIYMVVGAAQNIHESLFKTLDSSSRQLCPSLRYFAVLNMGDTMCGESTCISRIRNNLPATVLSLAKFKTGTNASWRDAIDAVERALCVTGGVLTARPVPINKRTVLERVAALAEITIPGGTPKDVTLNELGVKNDKLHSIVTFLRVCCNVSLEETQVLDLTLETIQNLEESDVIFEDIKGLGTFFSCVDSDELTATTELMLLPTITTGPIVREGEFDTSKPYLCIVPGIEGHHGRFKELCERLKVYALVLQPGLDFPHETVRDTAKRFTKSMATQVALKNNFYLLGYESGVLVALEMARILEEQGLSGTVYCIGYGPDELKKIIEEKLSEYKTEEQFHDALLRHMFKLMAGEDTAELDKALTNATTWPQKLDICVKTLKSHVSYSGQYASATIKAALGRIEQARRYSGAGLALRSRVVLMRAAPAHHAPTTTCLQQYSQQPVAVHQLSAPLAHAALDTQCTAIINQYLGDEILEDFKKKNICNNYMLNPNTFTFSNMGFVI